MSIKLHNSSNIAAVELTRRKKIARGHLRSLDPMKKIEMLAQLQEQYYQFLSIRAENGGRPIPEKWQKWYRARLSF
jgi:hypothetical protein